MMRIRLWTLLLFAFSSLALGACVAFLEDRREGDECERDSDCPPGCWCDGGVCVPGERPTGSGGGDPQPPRPTAECTDDWDCAEGFACESGRCYLDEVYCGEDAECPSGELCQDWICQPACEGDEECAIGELCDATGRCVVDERCSDARDCAEGELCVDGACLPEPSAPGGEEPVETPTIGDGLCAPGLACEGIEYCYDTCFTAECCTVVCNCDVHDDRLYCNLYCE